MKISVGTAVKVLRYLGYKSANVDLSTPKLSEFFTDILLDVAEEANLDDPKKPKLMKVIRKILKTIEAKGDGSVKVFRSEKDKAAKIAADKKARLEYEASLPPKKVKKKKVKKKPRKTATEFPKNIGVVKSIVRMLKRKPMTKPEIIAVLQKRYETKEEDAFVSTVTTVIPNKLHKKMGLIVCVIYKDGEKRFSIGDPFSK